MTDSRFEKPVLLALGCDAIADERLRDTCRLAHMTCDTFFRLSRAEFGKKNIQLVMSALFCAQTDCIEIGQHLSALGFQGIYLIRTDSLPDPTVIKRELHQLYPDLECQIMTSDDLMDFLGNPHTSPSQ